MCDREEDAFMRVGEVTRWRYARRRTSSTSSRLDTGTYVYDSEPPLCEGSSRWR